MGFFRKLFGKGDEESRARAAERYAMAGVASPDRIGYDPKLVPSLQRDHAELGGIYHRIGELHEAGGNYDEIRALLINFKSRLEAHLLTENVLFYNYLEQNLPDDSGNNQVMRDFRREMNQIARQVIDFVKRYQSCDFNAAERARFTSDHAAVGRILEQRLDREENNLYPLYRAA